MSVPLVMAAAATSVGAPAYAAGSKHERSARASTRTHHERILRRGATGPDVVRLQRALGITADGIFGRNTERAVLAFQRSHGILVDGEVGPQTWGTIGAGFRGHAGTIVLRLYDRGPAVAAVQRALGISADGDYGPVTVRAVRAFQGRHGLLVDGQVGPHTAGALHVRLSGPVTQYPHGGSSHGRTRHHHATHHVAPSSIILRLYDRGPAVFVVQRALGISADGDYGPVTVRAVRAFQGRHGLLVDGQVGPHTAAALHVRLSGPVTQYPHGGGTSSTPSHHHTSSAPSGVGARAALLARDYLGVPYRWGGSSPSGFDCSGLVYFVYGRLGVSLPRVTYSQWSAGRHVLRSELAPGDLVFFYGQSHVGIYIGGGRFIHAPHTGTSVRIDSLSGWYSSEYDGAVRVG